MNLEQINMMTNKVKSFRKKLATKASIGSWLQIASDETVKIMSDSGYDWLVIDMEHGSIDINNLPSMTNTISFSGCIPLVRIPSIDSHYCKAAMDSGAMGLVIPMVRSKNDIQKVIEFACWPPKGKRGVGYSNSNFFGKYFNQYKKISQSPILVAQIENQEVLNELDDILQIKMLDAIMIGPYDLCYSVTKNNDFENKEFVNTINIIRKKCKKYKKPCGIHIVDPDLPQLKKRISSGYRFIAYSTDANFLLKNSDKPKMKLK